jgi:uncharacterized membrane protein YozB (DUF420 family)
MESFLDTPGFLSSRSSLASDVSFLFAVLFSGLFLVSGYFAIKNHGATHHRMILFSTVSMFVYFIYYYRVRRMGFASFTDQVDFAGEGLVYTSVFRPLLWTHFLIVTLSTFFAVYTVISGFKAAVRQNGQMLLKNIRLSPSKVLWSISFIWLIFLGWWLQTVHAFTLGYRAILLFFGYILPAGIAFAIHKALPFSERRHRILGRLCLVLFACLLVTSTLTYSMLYIF